MASKIDFWTLLKMTQEYISSRYAAVLTDKEKLHQLKAYIDKYLRDCDFKVEGMTTKELIDKLRCRNGNSFSVDLVDGTYRAYSPEGEFLMLAKVETGVMHTVKSFFQV